MVLAPEHPLVAKLTTDEQRKQVDAYIAQTLRQSDIQRESADEEKSGVFTGGYAVNPANGERIPVWIADYVLLTYGTGAIMAVPAHDQRDFEFARKYGLEIRPVIQPQGVELDGAAMTEAYPHHGVMVNSGPFDGTPATEAKGMANPAVRAVTEWLKKKGAGRADVNYRLRDWLISRQRYWGAPIPMVHCKTCGWNPVPDDELPVLLPDDIEWMPTGESPLKLHPTWKNTTCPVCDEPAERETDTLDTFMCSSWYHLRYLSPGYDAGPFGQEDYDYWMPVDSYTGGAEHATMHLIYTRFFHKALRDMGMTEGHEPMLQYRSQGHILGPDGNRMSKSKGNVIDPDEQVRRYGADTVRAYLMFGYRWSEGGPWNTENIQGPVRWLRRVWDLFTSPPPHVKTDAGGDGGDQTAAAAAAARELRRKVHQGLIQVTLSYETYQFNTIISGLMELLNAIVELGEAGAAGTPAWEEAKDIYVRMMAPAVPHIAEELWTNVMGREYSVHQQPWPEVDEDAAREDVVMLPVQVNGKLRDRIELPAGFTQAEAEAAALASEIVQRFVDGKTPKKVIVVPGKLVNIVV
jgi:leucyl-tRNA synthetase